jgi:hypothetical protein
MSFAFFMLSPMAGKDVFLQKTIFLKISCPAARFNIL